MLSYGFYHFAVQSRQLKAYHYLNLLAVFPIWNRAVTCSTHCSVLEFLLHSAHRPLNIENIHDDLLCSRRIRRSTQA